MGKHADKRYVDIFNKDPGYVQWVLRQENLTQSLGDFAVFCRFTNAEEAVRKRKLCVRAPQLRKNVL